MTNENMTTQITKRRIVYPGSFDPITNGHLDIIDRAGRLFDHVTVAIAENPNKKTLLTLDERITLTRKCLKEKEDTVSVVGFRELLIDFVRKENAQSILRGLRAVADFEFELQMALMNRELAPDIETLFLMPRDTCTYLSSTIVKEIRRLGTSVVQFVPQCVDELLEKKFSS